MKILKKNLLNLTILGGLLLNSSTTFSQSNGEYNNMTKFDIQAFDLYKKGDLWEQTLADGTTIRQSGTPKSGYLVVITNNKNPYSENRMFNSQGELTGTGRYFHSFPIGTTIKYDGKGNIVSKGEHDLAFPFSLGDVAKKMHTEFKIDIMNQETVPIVSRSIDQNIVHIPYYIIYVVDPAERSQRIAYLVHGGTGELLFTRIMDIYRNDGVVLRSYAETLNQKKLNQK